jgi:hypothetical protein
VKRLIRKLTTAASEGAFMADQRKEDDPLLGRTSLKTFVNRISEDRKNFAQRFSQFEKNSEES